LRQPTFAEFLYAIVVATAISTLGTPEYTLEFWARLFLILAVLEDFFLYQTEVKPFLNDELTLTQLVFEGSILFTWYFAFVSYPNHLGKFLLCFALFYAPKWIAGVKNAFKRVDGKWRFDRDWRIHRDHTFLITTTFCIILLAILTSRGKLDQVEMWGVISVFWAVQTSAYWMITKLKQ
jgi:hypothetical protein